MPQNFETYRGGPPAKGGSGADNYVGAIQQGSDQQSGALQFIGKVLEQSAALRQQRAMHEEEQAFQQTRDTDSRKHEMALRQLIEEGWTSRKQMELDEEGAQKDLDREAAMGRKMADVFGDLAKANIDRQTKQEEASIRENARVAGEQFRATENERSRAAQWDREVFSQGQQNQRNQASIGARGTSGDKYESRTLPGFGKVTDYDGTLLKAKYEDEISPAARAQLEAAVDVKVARYGGIDPPRRGDASKKPLFDSEMDSLLKSLGIGRREAAAPPAPTAKKVTSLAEIPGDVVTAARARALKAPNPKVALRNALLEAGYDAGDFTEPPFDPGMENSVLNKKPAERKKTYAEERDPIRRLFGIGPLP